MIEQSIRVISFNIHKGNGWLKLKSTLRKMRDLLRELDPDIIFLQEVRNSQFEFLADQKWKHLSYGKNVVNKKGHHGNAILSKFPIIVSQNIDLTTRKIEKRGLLHSIVEINQSNLHLLCVHLGLLKKDRYKQLKQIVEYINENIPSNEPLILGGDFNDLYHNATIPLIDKLGLQEAFLEQDGKYAKTFPAWAPFLRLDRIYSRGLQPCEAQSLNHRHWRILSDHVAIGVSLLLITK